jgi:hypothetical protein
MSQYLSEAFKKLNILNEDTFTINNNGLEDFVKFEEEDKLEDSVDVFDPEATSVEELQDSYVGKVILDCCVCHSKIYKDVEDVVIEDDIANSNEECPFCYTTDGYKVIGQVSAFGEEETENTEDTDKEEDSKEEDDKDLEEGFFGLGKKKKKPDFYSKEEIAKRRAQREAEWEKRDEEQKEKERQRGAEIARDWARNDKNKRDAQKEAERERLSKIKGSKVSNTGKTGVHYSGGDYYSEELKESAEDTLTTINDSVNESKSIKESVNNVNVETDKDIINVETNDNGKVTVTTEPKETFVDSEEVITPIEPEVQSEISDNVEDGGEIEIDMDEFDEESFDELGEGYLKKVYENVDSFKTSNVSLIKDRLVVEGVIKFNSGKSKKTNFIFESREATKSGKVRFIGENKEISRGRKSFTVTGKVDNKKFMSESLNYNYGVKGVNGKAQRLYGTVRRGK